MIQAIANSYGKIRKQLFIFKGFHYHIGKISNVQAYTQWSEVATGGGLSNKLEQIQIRNFLYSI